jgi:hypothetical protein
LAPFRDAERRALFRPEDFRPLAARLELFRLDRLALFLADPPAAFLLDFLADFLALFLVPRFAAFLVPRLLDDFFADFLALVDFLEAFFRGRAGLVRLPPEDSLKSS